MNARPETSPPPEPADRHDPGPAAARARADGVRAPAPARVVPPIGGPILLGTAGWTDPTLTRGEVFYPAGVDTPEERLRHYATRFPLVEVDATYYALPTAGMAARWVERTPDDFVFDVKAHALMTGHPTEVRRLPKALRDALPTSLARAERLYAKDLPTELEDAVWTIFLDALEPLRRAGKLGAVLLQYPPWFVPSRANADAIIAARERLAPVRAAVEFRHRGWFRERVAERTLALLAEHDVTYVMVDEPQGLENSVPPVTAVTAGALAIVRLHGRRTEMWDKRGASVAEKYRYLYDPAELAEWRPRVLDVARAASRTHVVFNNCYANYGTTNAAEFGAMLAREPGPGSGGP